MKRVLTAGAIGLALTVQACNPAEEQAGNPVPEASTTAAPGAMGNMPMPSQAPAAGTTAEGTTYTTMGEVASVAADSVTINHEPVPALGWPSMTMTFRAPDAAMLSGLATGAPVQFTFRQEGSQNVLTEIARR